MCGFPFSAYPTSPLYSTLTTMDTDKVSLVYEDDTTTIIASTNKSTCWETEFGCCADNKTLATGANMKGCCSSSVYGCCPDDMKSAEGPNLEGKCSNTVLVKFSSL